MTNNYLVNKLQEGWDFTNIKPDGADNDCAYFTATYGWHNVAIRVEQNDNVFVKYDGDWHYFDTLQ